VEYAAFGRSIVDEIAKLTLKSPVLIPKMAAIPYLDIWQYVLFIRLFPLLSTS